VHRTTLVIAIPPYETDRTTVHFTNRNGRSLQIACDTIAFMKTSPDTMRLYLCGRLSIVRGDVLVSESDFPARQGRRFWAYLVIHRQQPVSRGDLATAIWGDAIPDAWESSLNAIAARLRRTLQPLLQDGLPRLIGEPGRYDLRLPNSIIIDFERARAGLHRADVLMFGERWPEALAEARVATEIAARGFLVGEGGAWVEGQRQLLHSVRVHAHACTVEAELRRGYVAAAEREAEQLIALDPLREASYHLLMRSLAAGGNASAVHRVVLECRRIFAGEGLTPSTETERLAHELAIR